MKIPFHPRLFSRSLFVALTLAATVAAIPTRSQAADVPDDEALKARAARLHSHAILVDGHNDIPHFMLDARYDLGEPSVGRYHTDLNRLKAGGVGAQFFAIWIDPALYATNGAAVRALKLIDAVQQNVAAHPQQMAFATSVADIRQAHRDNRIAALMGIEGGYAIEDSLELLRSFYRLGVRYMTLTHTRSTSWAGAATNGPGTGLTPFGREVVREMNRLGMLLDVSHVSDATMSDVLDETKVPVIASHSSARALCDVPRNIPDSLLQRIGTNDGIVMVNFYSGFLDTNYAAAKAALAEKMAAINKQFDHDLNGRRAAEARLAATLPSVPLATLADHIDHIVKIAGIDHVGIGSDYDGVERTPLGLEDTSCFPNLTIELLRRGYTDRAIQKILGENFLRVLGQAERFARRPSRKDDGH